MGSTAQQKCNVMLFLFLNNVMLLHASYVSA